MCSKYGSQLILDDTKAVFGPHSRVSRLYATLGMPASSQAFGAPSESACWLISTHPPAIKAFAVSFSAAISNHEFVNLTSIVTLGQA